MLNKNDKADILAAASILVAAKKRQFEDIWSFITADDYCCCFRWLEVSEKPLNDTVYAQHVGADNSSLWIIIDDND